MIKLRKQAGMSQDAAAKATGYSEGAISHLENRRRQPQRKLILALLRAYDAEHETAWFDEQLKLLKRKDWWDNLPDARQPTGFEVFLGLEDGARQVTSWEPLIIPGLLQSEGYVHMLMDPINDHVTNVTLESRRQVRLQRKEILTRSECPVQLWAITTEFALTSYDAPDAVKRDQLDHLLEMANLPTVSLQVVPNGGDVMRASRGPFTIMDFDQPDDPGVVYIETLVRAIWFEELADITQHRHLMNHLTASALSPKDSARLIEKTRKEV
ncbi:helix-turn-helix domain-containing protein [Saccharopolyspora pogona]|uniref:helix-turn-helix domain-containing protein n=1 Tax=Saccharopolyspora pogona TaxID=333966 RepID=UPI001CC269E1|nr:helix-turn-helix transcriptional regulator [Saccharopolyspora pogona]